MKKNVYVTLKVPAEVRKEMKQASAEYGINVYELAVRGWDLLKSELKKGERPQWVLPVDDEGVTMMWRAKTEHPDAYEIARRVLDMALRLAGGPPPRRLAPVSEISRPPKTGKPGTKKK